MTIRFELDYQQISQLEQKMMRLPKRMEKTINEVLHSEGIEIATQEITKLIPVSKWYNQARNKRHAKTSNWSRSEQGNLEFTIKTKGGAAKNPSSFGYLVFPNEGRGSSNPLEQRFAERGLQKAAPRIFEALNRNIDKVLEEEL